jgi:hypothetical protein
MQAQVDQLPVVPGVVLRCAAVLGRRFQAGMLLQMVPAGVLDGPSALEEQLELLQEAHLVERCTGLQYDDSGGTGDGGQAWKVWMAHFRSHLSLLLSPTPLVLYDRSYTLSCITTQTLCPLRHQFCNSLHQEVVYDGMAHAHRRHLHRKAAAAVEVQMACVAGILERRPLLKSASWHMLKAMKRGGSSDALMGQRIDVEELTAVARTLGNAASNSEAVGDFTGAMGYWVSASAMSLHAHEIDVSNTLPSCLSLLLSRCVHQINTTFPLLPLPILSDSAARDASGAEPGDGALGVGDADTGERGARGHAPVLHGSVLPGQN